MPASNYYLELQASACTRQTRCLRWNVVRLYSFLFTGRQFVVWIQVVLKAACIYVGDDVSYSPIYIDTAMAIDGTRRRLMTVVKLESTTLAHINYSVRTTLKDVLFPP